MPTSFEYAESSLLCAEEDKSIFDEVDNYGNSLEICNWQHRDQPRNLNHHQVHNFVFCGGKGLGLGLGLSLELDSMQMQSEECLDSLFVKESQHLPALGYLKRLRAGDLDLGARKQVIHWIQKVQSHYNFGPLCVYLAVNYLDRFLSAYELPKGKSWMMQLLAVACLSLAAKMEETEVPLSLDLQVGEAKFVFEAKTIQRMELLVLSTLKWRMQAVTPFSFIDYFLYKLNGDQIPPRTLLFQSVQLILSTIKGIDLLEFRPSEIAAAVAISVTEETQIAENPVKAFSFDSHHLQKERVLKCVELIHDLTWSSNSNTSSSNTRCKRGASSSGSGLGSVPQSPIGVLENACMSYKSDDSSASASSTPTGSGTNSAQTSPSPTPTRPVPKRRKLGLARSLNF